MKNFMNPMSHNRKGFQYHGKNFLRIGEAKLKEEFYVGLKIRELVKDTSFGMTLNETGKNGSLSQCFGDTKKLKKTIRKSL